MKIKDLPKVDRPREKLEKYGPEKLSNSELLAILLRTGSKGINVVELARKILGKFSGSGLAKANFKDLKNTFGLGAAKACEIVACFELGRRLLQNKKSQIYLTPKDVWNEYFAPVFGEKDIYLLGVYSHIIHSFLYLPDYAIGHMIAFQVKDQMKKAGNIGGEFERMALMGNVAPDLWMINAAGTPVGAEALLEATSKAIEFVR